ncbi:hypothetical protein FMEAI12_3560009 [Parafrankia sp. Ea1.12]|uniref:hypothetical protein n=1 Tax=Parafrankia sp. Ea1.12 TaxID=573499 RepID=UPI000DA4B8D7|nr:hypothetical protein [Parafrankia sp. Ea1.12]SQD96264.1 hypothetical protein FMEAI12_3560009 [Parafrankia sp. Ea1.12]
MAKKAKTLDDLRRLGEDVRSTEKALDAARAARDEGIRDVRALREHTLAELADAAGVSVPTVRAVTRGLRP